MPTIRTLTVVAPGGAAAPLSGNQYEFLPFNAAVEFAVISDVATVDSTIFSGSDVLQQAGPVSQKAVGAAPVYPDDFLLSDVAAAGERLSVQIHNGNAAAATVQTVVRITPL